MSTDQSISLVTGAAGLLGNDLVQLLLSQGKKVRAVYHHTPIQIPQHPLLEVIHCDLLDVIALEEILKDITHVYHCAGLVNFSSRQQQRLYKINVEATANLVNACLIANVKKMVHVSSVAALGRAGHKSFITEETQWKSSESSVYGYSKYLGEMEVWRGIAEGLHAVIVNPSIILGPGDWSKGSTSIFKKVRDGFNWYTEGVNGFVDVRDVSKAMTSLMLADIQSEKFIISAENRSYKDVFFEIADAFKIQRPQRRVSPFLAKLTWRLEGIRSFFSGKEPLITRETINTAMSIYQYDASKLKKMLPYFEFTSLSKTIQDTCETLTKG